MPIKKVTREKKSIAGKKMSFRSKIVNWAEGMDYCAIPVPSSVTKKLGTKAAVLVMARVNKSEPFKISLFPAGEGKHFIRLKKKIRLVAKLKEGDSVSVHLLILDRDEDAMIADDLEAALRDEDVLNEFKAISPGARNYLIRRIDEAAKVETRKKRIAAAVEAAHEKREKMKKS